MNMDFLNVPEDWAHRKTSVQLRVFYYFYKASASSQIPTIFFNGGPGFSGHNLLATWNAILPKVQIPFVMVDQRGTGCSSSYPILNLENESDRLSFYGSRAIVEDAEAIREALYGKNSKWKIFGQSYGGTIVHRYLLTHPESIVSASIHGLALSRNQLGPYYFRMLGQKRISDAYLSEHPQDREKLAKVRRQIKPDLCFSKNKFKVCGEGTWDAILAYLFNGKASTLLPAVLSQLLSSDAKLDQKVFADLANKYVLSLYASADQNGAESPEQFAALVARFYIGKMEMNTGRVDASDPANCNLILKTLKSENPKKWVINICRFIQAMHNDDIVKELKDKVKVKSDPLDLEMFKDSMQKHPEVPVYLYSGAQDSFEPTELFQDEKSEVEQIHYVDFQNSGHEGFCTEAQVWKDLKAGPQ